MMQKRNIKMFPLLSSHQIFSTRPQTLMLSLLILLFTLPMAKYAQGQTEEIAVMQEVESLIDQLNSGAVADRDAAQEKLVALSPDALDFIDVPDKNATSDFIERLMKVRKVLETKAVQEATRPSSVTIDGTFSVKEALAKIAKQTRNKIALAEGLPPEITKRPVVMKLSSAPFWTAINSVMQQAKLEVDTYGGRAGQIVLVPSAQPVNGMMGDEADAEQPEGENPEGEQPKGDQPVPKSAIPQTSTGILALEINRIDASHVPGSPHLDLTSLNMRIRWEPRVQPISIQLNQADLKIIDDQGNEISPRRKGTINAAVQTEIPELEFSLGLPSIDRRVNQIKSLSGTMQAILPGRLETFRFRKVGDIEDGTSQTKSGATVTFGGVEINEELYGVTVGLAFEGESNEQDSHQGWTFENEAYLVDPKDPNKRHEAVAYETVAQNGQTSSVEYYFEVDPDGYDLVYETPAAIVSADFKFELKDIPLP